ncbi:MAG: TatD family hydrolase, partial [Oscillospiraceae bacterium]|nr:TatD family hydrolase [Oscillospiraceae bacterium]
MYFDTHAHYDDNQFKDDADEVLSSMQSGGVSLILNAGSTLRRSEQCLKIADKYPFIYASVGAHPHGSRKVSSADLQKMEKLLSHPKAMAVGEIGLDYHYDFSPRDVQKDVFIKQLEIARQINKPVIIHEREALNDMFEIISNFKDLTGVFHCFSG